MAKNKWIIKMFEKSGDVGPQPNLLKILKDKFISMTLDEFVTPFIDSLMSVIIAPTTIHCVVVNNMIQFAANGVSVLTEHSTSDGRSGLCLMTEVFRLCRKYGNANDQAIRWRFCYFINHLLNYMSHGTVLSVELCDIATLLLLDRLQDKKPEIRTQAAYGLHRLQITDNPRCPIVKKFTFHMICDPSIEVRTAIVKEIAMFSNVVDEMLKSTILDVSDNVRKEAYNRFLEYPFLSLSSKQRQTILEKGLDDKNGSIKSFVKKRLLESWLEECNNDFVIFLNKLGVENEIVCEKTLILMFESFYDSQVLDLANKYLNCETRMIDFKQLTVEKIFLWKCVAKYLTTEKKIELARNQGHFDDDYIDILLPDLIKFSDYVRKYYFTYNSEDNKEFMLIQLLDMTRTFAIDDVGAASLNKLCFDLILDNQMSVKSLKPIAILLDLTMKNGQDILNYVKQILNEIQAQTIDFYPTIDKLGKKEVLEQEIESKSRIIEELIEDAESADKEKMRELIIKVKRLNTQCKEIIVTPEEVTQVNMAVKYVSKGFELIFQIQQLPKVGHELSLLTDIIQNIVVGYLECSMVSLRMEAIRSLSPYLLANNVAAAKEHMNTLCSEISNPRTNRHLVFKIMFELFLRYNLSTFNMNDDLDTNEVPGDHFSADSVLSLLANCIDYEVNDSCFKSVVIQGFCNLLLFKKVKSINLLSKLLIIWFKRISRETYNIYNDLVKFFTCYVFYVRSSSSSLAKCYVQVLKMIDEHDLITKLDIKLEEVNSTLINLTRGLMFNSEEMAINSHGELASYILDYLLDDDQPYTAMLVDTLYKLEMNLDQDDELVIKLGPKLVQVIKHFKNMDDDKNSMKYLKKIKYKFDPVLQRKASLKKSDKKEFDDVIEIVEESQVTSCSTKIPNPVVEVHSDLFSQENLNVSSSSDDDDDDNVEAFTKLDAIKRMSEIFKKSFNSKNVVEMTSESD